MRWRQFFRRKPLETLLAEMAGEHRLHRVLGPVSLTSLGVGAIIGAGHFRDDRSRGGGRCGSRRRGLLHHCGIACMLAAFCYSEFAAMAPVAGSAYTYTYATLGEIWAWIIGWDLVLEYAMSCSVVAAHWSHYLDEFLWISFGWNIPPQFLSDPFTPVIVDGLALQAYINLPAILVMAVITLVLVIGIRESALTNAVLVMVKTAVVLFVIVLGWSYVQYSNWTSVPVERRKVSDVADYLERNPRTCGSGARRARWARLTTGKEFLKQHPEIADVAQRRRAVGGGAVAERGEEVGPAGGVGSQEVAAADR